MLGIIIKYQREVRHQTPSHPMQMLMLMARDHDENNGGLGFLKSMISCCLVFLRKSFKIFPYDATSSSNSLLYLKASF
jgi:hypothetical protein